MRLRENCCDNDVRVCLQLQQRHACGQTLDSSDSVVAQEQLLKLSEAVQALEGREKGRNVTFFHRTKESGRT